MDAEGSSSDWTDLYSSNEDDVDFFSSDESENGDDCMDIIGDEFSLASECMSDDLDDDDLNESFFEDIDSSDPGDDAPSSTSTEPGKRPGANINLFMAYLLNFLYGIRHCLTGKALKELLQLFSVVLPSESSIPKSVYALKKVFTRMFPAIQPSKQDFCIKCHRLLSQSGQQCENCQLKNNME